MRLVKWFLMACFLTGLGSPVVACRFNVRDVGFVDLGNQSYGFFCYVNDRTEKHVIDYFNELAETELLETNIKARSINVDQRPDDSALQYLKPDTKIFPAFVLISPGEQTMRFDSIESGQGFKESLQKAFKKIVSSPMRKELAEKTIDAFGVVLIIEGADAEENKKAVSAAQAAIKLVSDQMNLLPKRIAKPPVLVEMKRQQQQQEEILLWSMGIDADNITKPHAIIFYGRGRRMGSVLSKKLLTEKMMTKFLYVIGADCECGLDRSWMQGDMMPAKWGGEQLEKLSAQLGFDTEHPMIKIEMSQIVRSGNRSGNNTLNFDAIGSFGYREIEVRFDTPTTAQKVNGDTESSGSVSQQSPQTSNDEVQEDASAEQSKDTEDEFKLWSPLYMIGMAGIIILAVGAYFIISASGKKQ
ncbi:hypothetical protein ACFL1G_05285 [Planctomycetota bacterium]